MTFQKRTRNWKNVRATNIRDALRLCKDYAKDKQNLSVAQIAELLSITEEALYKWLSSGSMPAHKILAYEHVCGCHFVTDYLASSNGQLVIQIPLGRAPTPMEINDLQMLINESLRDLMLYYDGNSDPKNTENSLTSALMGLAVHREVVKQGEQQALEFGVGE